ncbi:replication fork protection component Swi3-domain-containing protein [Cantharellus anzutake]|uniref:replication fork protection component Swi3-domain-containing protein n=1 Tax=Cantharellus anzutake TaxID=1750568 RepID=UPI0019048427|nr:replication fork protection component Swi3-domain-containing protein [Cantharellus anzutake]KAF8328693.1 replication fork protection component Swi3-domain-containing protein [Cantharellus anzutake]
MEDGRVVPNGSRGKARAEVGMATPLAYTFGATANLVSAELDALFANLSDDNRAPTPSSSGAGGLSSKKRRGRTTNVLLSDDEEGGKTQQPQTRPDDDEAPKAKKTRKIAKLDEDRLCGPNGFPALIEHHRKFKPSGKGNENLMSCEAKDLQRLLQIYQLWSHKMYPRTQFRDSIERIEKLCRSRSMHSALSKWKDDLAPKPVIPSRDSSPVNEENIDDDDEDVSNSQHIPNGTSLNTNVDSRDPSQPSTISGGRAINPSNDDDWDLDALISEDIAFRRQQGLSSDLQPQPQRAPVGAEGKRLFLDDPGPDDWDVDAMIEEQERFEMEERTHPSATNGIGNVPVDDNEMWNMVGEIGMGR